MNPLIQHIEEKLQIDQMPQQVKVTIINGLALNIMKRVLLTVVETLPDEEIATLTSALEKGNVEEVFRLLIETHPELEEKVYATRDEVIEEFLAKEPAV